MAAAGCPRSRRRLRLRAARRLHRRDYTHQRFVEPGLLRRPQLLHLRSRRVPPPQTRKQSSARSRCAFADSRPLYSHSCPTACPGGLGARRRCSKWTNGQVPEEVPLRHHERATLQARGACGVRATTRSASAGGAGIRRRLEPAARTLLFQRWMCSDGLALIGCDTFWRSRPPIG